MAEQVRESILRSGDEQARVRAEAMDLRSASSTDQQQLIRRRLLDVIDDYHLDWCFREYQL